MNGHKIWISTSNLKNIDFKL